ncbi:MAG: hypothetical protein HY335_09185, partial [Deinococcus sp.]|nr:hypothetical protein [Deinococcus sp.]
MRQFLLTTNGPGELYTWVRPVALELRRQFPGSRLIVVLVPCQFASGREALQAH